MIYDTTAPFYDLFDADDPGALWHREFVLARTKGIDAVMDVGAGTGRTAMALAERGLRVWAVEPSRGMRGVMLARLGDDTSLDERLTIVPGDAQTCDLGRSFPLIVFSHALYLLDGSATRVAALANLAGHLAPGGRLTARRRDRDRVAPGPGSGTYFLSRLIRLDVSQRLPPSVCTSP